ncbi:MAG: class I tRNA ligase family protein [Planctomycetota bacterium]|jgi:valyl-tRNA synthetase
MAGEAPASTKRFAEEPLPESRYDPDVMEEPIREAWRTLKGFERPDRENSQRNTMLLEPSHLSGPIHMGGALGALLADVLARARRMQGEDVLLLTGFHHADICTPQGFKRILGDEGAAKEGPTTPSDREWEAVQKWKQRVTEEVEDQFRRLGISCDTRRFFSSFDEETREAIDEAFRRLYEDDLIYREKKLVTWCPTCRSRLSGNEIETKTEKGNLWYVRYPIEGEVEKFLTVAVPDPESIQGDQGLLVSPEDERYAEILGAQVLQPITQDTIPVFPEPRVDPRRGTGVVRMTPGKDPEHYERARASGKEPAPLYDPEGTMGEGAGTFRGLDVISARKAALELLEGGGFLDRQETLEIEKAVCIHCGRRVVPVVSEQWFLRIRILAERVAVAVRSGSVRFYPERWKKAFLTWAETAQPWCISQPDIWGQRIAVSYCQRCGVPHMKPRPEGGCRECGNRYFRDGEDILDPWFSAVLAPLGALGWTHGEGGRSGIPVSTVIASQRRFFQWTARLLALGSALSGRPFFREVVIHGRIEGEKGSTGDREPGERIDPRHAISTNGADAVRLSLAEVPYDVQDVHLSVERVDAGRHLVNKLWNAARFAARHFALPAGGEAGGEKAPEDEWILGRLDATAASVTRALQEVNPEQVVNVAAEFLRHDFCGWYIEMAKRRLRSGRQVDATRRTLGRVIFTLLRILHPIVPFMTEAIWRRFVGTTKKKGLGYPLVWAPWPTGKNTGADSTLMERMATFQEVVRAVRSIRTKYRLPLTQPITLAVSFTERTGRTTIEVFADLLRDLVNAEELNMGVHLTKPASCATEILGAFQIFVPLMERPQSEAEMIRLQVRKARLEDRLIRISRPLESWEFMNKAPHEVRNTLQRRKEILAAQILHLEENITELRGHMALAGGDGKSTT